MPNESAIDPVCGMTIATDGALTREYEAAVYHFCSELCASRFDSDAVAYIAASRLGLDGWGQTPAPGFLSRRGLGDE